ncbi:MAG TPA: hypothetical protein VGO31_10335 [Microbacteriaceae bacterium]|nr:hypothetical protein [Microbacteriaceae bacterium]
MVTSAGGLVSLATAFAALSPHAALTATPFRAGLIIASLICFVAAIMAGIAANAPMRYGEPKLDDIAKGIEDFWTGSRSEAAQQNARAWLATINRARDMNLIKSRWVIAALALEGSAFALLALMAAVLLL